MPRTSASSSAPVPVIAPLRSGEPRPFRIVHATNHPGIEGTRHIVAAVESLKKKGYDIELRLLSGVTQERVLAEMADADLTVGKMKMGYYANAQVESLALGVPAVTCVRPEFLTPELVESGSIFATIDTLEATLEEEPVQPAGAGGQAEQGARERRAIAR